MTIVQPRPYDAEYADFGLNAFEVHPHTGGARGHRHDSLEISVFEHGSVTMLFGGKTMTVAPNQLVIFWGILPHTVLHYNSDAIVVGLHLPLAWFLKWDLPGDLRRRVLNLDVLVDQPRQAPCSDLDLMHNWVQFLRVRDREKQNIALLELHARLSRLSLTLATNHNPTAATKHPPAASTGAFERAIHYISEHFTSPIRLADIADAAGVSSGHLARLFRRTTGSTVNEYITHLRVSLAQRLLVTTDRKVIDIMYDAGFSCSTHFYKVFKQHTDLTPGRYRRRTG
jgi:AraC-like DNA-binding protein